MDDPQFPGQLPTPPSARPPQFNLRMLLYFTTGLCVLFALLAALGVKPLQALIGFGFVTAIVLLQAAVVEFFTRR